ncbi:MAG: HlyD family type I secretion periplasmic adaptor subunit [Alphaproteobacteria bacterium]|nr:HlyD family type I secretion periplasmic adaptor subunit [Alphaproteobacteria bacterium]
MSLLKPDIIDTDFMSELEAATNMRPAKSVIFMLFSIIALIVFGITWASVSKVEEITRGQGQVVPSQEIQVVQSLEGGILQDLLVKEGDLVKRDQILLRLSDVQFASQERGTEAKSLALRVKKLRFEAEASGENFVVPDEIKVKALQIADNELALYVSRQKELQSVYGILDEKIRQASAEISEVTAQINRFYQSRKLLKEELEITKEMVRKRAVPKLEELRLQREVNDMSGQINALVENKKGLIAKKKVAQKERDSQNDKFRSQALGELNSVETEILGLEESLKSIGDRVDRTEIRAPVDGVINKIAIKTIGGIVEPAMKLVEIVPLDDELKIIARVSPSEIAFIHPGQAVKVKITAYDAQKYGSLDGTLVRIGANSGSDRDGNTFFEIEVQTNKNYMGDEVNPLPISPGMVAEIEVITGKRTILAYLLKPLLRARNRAFTEH